MNASPLAPNEARTIVLARVLALSTETVSHADALGHVLAENVVSSLDLPPFPNSAMDGYAARAADLAAAPRTLQVIETIGAGEVATCRVESGNCIKIMTGAPLPEGADCVVMREETREAHGQVEFLEAVRLGQHIRPQGDDVKEGEVVFETGTLVGAAVHAMLASL